MVRVSEARRITEKAFSPAEQAIKKQETQTQAQLRQAKQRVVREQELLSQARTKASTQQVLRGLTAQGAAARRTYLARLGRQEAQLGQLRKQISTEERRTQKQFLAAKKKLRVEKEVFRKKLFRPTGFVNVGKGEGRIVRVPVFATGETLGRKRDPTAIITKGTKVVERPALSNLFGITRATGKRKAGETPTFIRIKNFNPARVVTRTSEGGVSTTRKRRK